MDNVTKDQLMTENAELKKKVAELEAKAAKTKEVLLDLHPHLIGLSRLSNCHVVRELKKRLQAFRDITDPVLCAELEKKM